MTDASGEPQASGDSSGGVPQEPAGDTAPATCTFPTGPDDDPELTLCGRPRVAKEPGTRGPAPEYCENPAHTPLKAHRRRKKAKDARERGDAPVIAPELLTLDPDREVTDSATAMPVVRTRWNQALDERQAFLVRSNAELAQAQEGTRAQIDAAEADAARKVEEARAEAEAAKQRDDALAERDEEHERQVAAVRAKAAEDIAEARGEAEAARHLADQEKQAVQAARNDAAEDRGRLESAQADLTAERARATDLQGRLDAAEKRHAADQAKWDQRLAAAEKRYDDTVAADREAWAAQNAEIKWAHDNQTATLERALSEARQQLAALAPAASGEDDPSPDAGTRKRTTKRP